MAQTVHPPSLRSADVIERLTAGDPLLVEGIVSRLSSKLLQAFEAEIPSIKDWDQKVKKLKLFLRIQVEALGRASASRKLLNDLVVAHGGEIAKPLQDLIYEYFLLSQDLLLLLRNVEYSTWNFLDFLEPDYWFAVRAIPIAILERFDRNVNPTASTPSEPLTTFGERLAAEGMGRASVESTILALAEWLQRAQEYERLMNSFYGTEDPVESFYAFHYTASAAIDLLSRTLTMKLVLKPLRNYLGPMPSQ